MTEPDPTPSFDPSADPVEPIEVTPEAPVVEPGAPTDTPVEPDVPEETPVDTPDQPDVPSETPNAPEADTSKKDEKPSYLSGLFPSRDNDNAPDIEQEKRAQARQEHEFALGNASEHPAFAKKGPTRDEEFATSDSNRTPSQAKADRVVL